MRKIAFACATALGVTACGSDEAGSLGGDPQAVAAEAEAEAQQKPTRREGPFGISAGMPLAELSTEGDREAETGLSVLTAAPNPNNQFPNVAVISFPQTGVCEVRALSKEFDSDPYISSASTFADEVAAALETRYGKSKKVDGCNGFACRSDYKLQHIQDGSVWYGYQWPAAAGDPLPSQVKSIDLHVVHAEFNDSQVRLDYKFNNAERCETATRAAKAGNL